MGLKKFKQLFHVVSGLVTFWAGCLDTPTNNGPTFLPDHTCLDDSLGEFIVLWTLNIHTLKGDMFIESASNHCGRVMHICISKPDHHWFR